MRISADIIVVGSGPSASSAAFPPAESGFKVLMLDVGNEDTRYAPLIPSASFLQVRRTDPAQHRYFLGDEYEGVPLGRVRVGAQLTPPRQYIARDTDTLTPLRSSTFFPTESLALGGLGSGWGASAVQLDDRDLAGFPISAADLAAHYEAVAARIGISGERDDLWPFYGPCSSLQPPLEMDSNARALMSRYQRKRSRLNRAGLYMGRPRLAVLTRDLGDREAQRYLEMDFYADPDRSVYRPRFTVDAMRALPGFTYKRPYLVESFRELSDGSGVEVAAIETRSNQAVTFTARRLILAAGTMGTARIVLRSFDMYNTPLPLVSNAHIYVPCVNLPMLGKSMSERRHSLTQAGLIYDPPGGDSALVYAEVHGYRSLLLFKLAKEIFLPIPEAVGILRELISALVILVIEHEDHPAPGNQCLLRKGPPGSRDILEVAYQEDTHAARRQRESERRLLGLFRRLGCLPLKRIDPGPGSSIHYGGPLPMTDQQRQMTTTPAGLLRGTRTVYVADGSVLPYLPAKPLTLTLMANADRVGKIVMKDLR